MHENPEPIPLPADLLELPERQPWRGPSPPGSVISPRLQWAVAVLIVVGHVLLIGWIDRSSRVVRTAQPGEAITVVFLPADVLTRIPAAPPPPLPPARRQARGPVEPQARRQVQRPQAGAMPDLPAAAIQQNDLAPDEPPARRAQLFREDGSIDLPKEVIADIESVTSGDRQFRVRDPGLAAADAFAQRKPALEYEPTRFDEHWQPQQGVITETLARAVEKTTVTVRIPVFRSPGYRFTCKASILALAGGCGLQRPNDGYVVVVDDPDTLDVEEDQQCQQLWQQIVEATSQSKWRALSLRYERDCSKPLVAGIRATSD